MEHETKTLMIRNISAPYGDTWRHYTKSFPKTSEGRNQSQEIGWKLDQLYAHMTFTIHACNPSCSEDTNLRHCERNF